MDVTINESSINVPAELGTWGELLDWIEKDYLKAGQCITRVFLAGNEERGNYIVTAFLAGSIPYGRFASRYGSITPTFAFGKGFHSFDFQSTIGWTIPTGGRQTSGTPVVYNTAFQYHVLRKLWPEAEINATFWPNGKLDGDKQVFLSPGLVAGRFHLWNRLGMSIGAGEQIAVTHFHQYNHAKALSIRFPF